MKPSLRSGILIAALVAAFAIGQARSSGGGLLGASRGDAELQLRQDPQGNQLPVQQSEQPLVWGGDSGQAAAANGILAVTGSYGVGTSVLYVIDTERRQLAVYEARGGSPGGRRLVLVGARRIDLDLELEGYNDESEFSYRDLARRFEQSGASGASGESGPGETGTTGREK